ncbi:PKD-like family lipoprotein [Longitalea luteola]|uniref:PKD-like family lipoprotein n=1 Tax=Longitalea luteola TaxID=2812563 RepID=UPI001A95CB77|nr:PKD-like family lipoprotein [Longitalea luteola]
MKKIILVLLSAFALVQQACYKDKGNYEYNMPVAPTISGLDTLYTVALGDTLIIQPTVTTTDPNARFFYSWTISIPEQFRDTVITGFPLKYAFGLDPKKYAARMTITDSSNGMKYFREFMIDGQTEFSVGTLVLTLENNTSQLNFVKPDGSVISRVYRAIHGVDLPGGPQQIIPLVHQALTTKPTFCYWVTGTETNDAGVRLATNTLIQINTLRKNFFDPPASAVPGQLESKADGVLRGVINKKLYVGAWKTFYGFPIYGYFGVPTAGDYELYRQVIFNQAPYIIGYDSKAKKVVAFTNFGDPAYIGTDYQVTTTTPFDPKNVGLDLLHFQQIGGNNCFAFGKAADGTLYELKFGADFMGFIQLSPQYKRAFAQPGLITPLTRWAGAPGEIFYFNSGDKIYRYNPLNQEIRPLITDFGGKTVSMVKMIDNGNTLVAGIEGSLYFLDVSTGKFGDIVKKYDGIPGAPVDIAIKN